MSLSSTTSRVSYTGNNTTDTYAYTFKIFSASDLRVTKVISGVESTLVLNTDYTVTGVGGVSGGNIVLTAGNLATGHILVIRRVRTLTQTTDIRNQGTFYPEAHENVFDKLVMNDQQQQDEINRSVKLPESLTSSSFDPTLPRDIVGASGKVPVLNSTGDGFDDAANWPTVDEIDNAQGYATAAAASAAAASASQTAAGVSAAAALASEGLAQDWATETASTVDGSEYSSKEYAVGIQRRGLANGGSAKDWANYTGGTVDNTEYSAKKYAQDAAASAASMAQRDLSNLTATAINVDLDPDASGTRSLGSTNYWLNVLSQFFIVPSGVSGRFGTPNRTGSDNSTDATFRSGTTVNGNSGDAYVGAGSVSGSGLRGFLSLLGRFVIFPTASADPSTPSTAAVYYNSAVGYLKYYTGSAWSSFLNWATLNDLTAETAPATADIVLLGDASATASRKMTLDNLWKVINSFTTETTIDQAADSLAVYDSSANAIRKMTIDSILSGKRPIALVHRNGSGQLISNTTTTVIDWTTASIDTNSIFDDANNRLVPNVAGHYLCAVNVNIDAGVDTAIVEAKIRKNGSDVAVGQNMSAQSGSKDNTEFIATIQYMNGTTDYFDATVLQDYGSSQNLDGGAGKTFFFCMRIA